MQHNKNNLPSLLMVFHLKWCILFLTKETLFYRNRHQYLDNEIRERGYILKEDGMYHLWYTSYTNIDSVKWLGYATSPDGYNWTRYKDNPIQPRLGGRYVRN